MTWVTVQLALASTLLALAACGGETQQEAAMPQQIESPASAARPEPEATPTADPAARMIPVEFLGVWDAETGTCDPASDRRLEIGENRIIFYESVGAVESVRDDAGTTLVTLAMEGEGERWTQTLGLRFFDAGTSLMVIDPDLPDEAEQSMRKRCRA